MATPIVGWKEIQFGQAQLCYQREGVQNRSWLSVLGYRACQDRTFLRLVIGKDRDLVTTCFEDPLVGSMHHYGVNADGQALHSILLVPTARALHIPLN
uniref:Uncharacterized protein n=1 Tax=Brassica campestris TaxID=3711 RepID=M4DID0_BRACM